MEPFLVVGANACTVLLTLASVTVLHDDLPPACLVAAAVVGLSALAALGVGARAVSWRAQPAVLQRRDVVT
ncbi:MAG: hypothetical protein ABIQ59_11900 [Nocardioidaceae bacterium]